MAKDKILLLLSLFLMLVFCCVSAPVFAEEANSVEEAEYMKNLEEAADFLEKYIEAHPDDADAILQLGITYIKTGKHTEAVRILEDAVRISREPAFPYAWLARAKAEIGMYEEAVKLVDKALEAGGDDTSLVIFSGGVLYETEDYEGAAEKAREVLDSEELNQYDVGAATALLFFSLYPTEGADATVAEIRDLNATYQSACIGISVADVFVGQGADYYNQTIEALDSISEECDVCGVVSMRYGYIADKRGDFDEAEAQYKAAHDSECNAPALYFDEGAPDILKINAFRKGGGAPEEIIDSLATGDAEKIPLPYRYWILSLAYHETEDEDAASEYYLDGARKFPVNFMKPPGSYTVLTQKDYDALDEISRTAEEDMEYFELQCNPEHPLPVGTFFTTSVAPGLHSLFRFIGEGDSPDICGFAVYSGEDDVIAKVKTGEMILSPLGFSEDAFFIYHLYPSKDTLQKYWYVPVADIFPLLLSE